MQAASKLLKAGIESLVIVMLFLALSMLLHSPLSLNSPFPWIWFAPILIALRYGLWLAAASILILLGVYLYREPSEILTTSFQLFVLGGFLLTLICTLFQHRFSKKLADAEEISNYLQARIQSTAEAYYVVLLAYQRLEQHYIIKPVTLRSSLIELREMLARQNTDSLEQTYSRLLHLLASNASIEIAGILVVNHKTINPHPIAQLGNLKPPSQQDSLLNACIDSSAITYAKTKSILDGRFSDYLVAAPFLNQANEIEAILLIQSMPFLSLNDENIGMIDVLIRYFTGGHTVNKALPILNEYPQCPVDFANELARLIQLQQHTLYDSAVLAFKIPPHSHQDDYLFRLSREQRGLDTSWQINEDNYKLLLFIMPMTARAGVESYKLRINELFMSEFDTVLNGSLIQFKACQLSAFKNPLDVLRDLLS